MKSSIKILGIVLVFLIAGTTLLTAQYGMGRGNLRGQYFCRIYDLTEKQKTDLTAIREKHLIQRNDLRTEMQGTTDIEKRGEIAKKIQILRDTHREDIINQLTDKQKEALNSNNKFSTCTVGRGPMNGNFRGRGPCGGGMGWWNFACGRGPGRGMGYGNMSCRW
jgi:hypothetical protein